MANKRIIELQERTSIDMGDWLIVDSSTSTRKLSLATLFNYMTLTSMIFVTELPTTDISESTIYLVPHSGSTTDWDEYIYRDNEWIQIGTSTIDLSAIYQTKTDNNLQTTSKQIVGAINEVHSELKKNVLATIQLGANDTYGTMARKISDIMLEHTDVDWSKLNLIIGDDTTGSVNVMHVMRYNHNGYIDFTSVDYGNALSSLECRPTTSSQPTSYITLGYNTTAGTWAQNDYTNVSLANYKVVITL